MWHDLEDLVNRYPSLAEAREGIAEAYSAMESCYRRGGKLLVAGNGGSACDAQHIVAELMKGFKNERPLPPELKERLVRADPVRGERLAARLQQPLTAIALNGHSGLDTAFANDVDGVLCAAQQINGFGRQGDILLAISTSGNSENILYAAVMARAAGILVIGFTGETGGKLAGLCDICVRIPGREADLVQELQLPVYHCWCRMLERAFFAPRGQEEPA